MKTDLLPAPASGRRRWGLVFVSAVVLIFVLLGIVASRAGLRGSDQYWYIADTESLLEGNGVQTNYVSLYNIVGDTTVQSRGFVHNVPQIYLAVIPGLFLGAFNAWLLMNASLTILAAVLLYLTLKKFLPAGLSGLVSLQFLVLPLAFWHSYQPLGEAFQVLLVVSMLYVYYCGRGISRYFLLGLLSVVLLLCRNNYVLVPVFVAGVLLFDGKGRYRLLYPVLFLAGVVALAFSLKTFFPETYDYSYYYVAVSGKVGALTTTKIADLLSIYGEKLAVFFTTQFATFDRSAIFYQPFNLLAMGTVLLWFAGRRKGTIAPVILVVSSYVFLLLTAMIAQIQARYLLPFYPVVFFAFFVQAGDILQTASKNRLATALLAIAIVMSLFVDANISMGLVREGTTEAAVRRYYSSALDESIAKDESLIFCNQGWDFIMYGYLVRPRYLFLGDEWTYLDTNRYRRLIEAEKIQWLLTSTDRGQTMFLSSHRLDLEKEIPAFEDEPMRYLYRIAGAD